jgi:hypothetical protein
MAALDLSVVPGRERPNAFVLNTQPIQCNFKERFLVGALGVEPVGKLRIIVGLDTFDGEGEAFHAVFDELRRRIGFTCLWFCLVNSTLARRFPIRYLFYLLSHFIVETYSKFSIFPYILLSIAVYCIIIL